MVLCTILSVQRTVRCCTVCIGRDFLTVLLRDSAAQCWVLLYIDATL
jgi:hypothetical protein